jgi:hypothetical protein
MLSWFIVIKHEKKCVLAFKDFIFEVCMIYGGNWKMWIGSQKFRKYNIEVLNFLRTIYGEIEH